MQYFGSSHYLLQITQPTRQHLVNISPHFLLISKLILVRLNYSVNFSATTRKYVLKDVMRLLMILQNWSNTMGDRQNILNSIWLYIKFETNSLKATKKVFLIYSLIQGSNKNYSICNKRRINHNHILGLILSKDNKMKIPIFEMSLIIIMQN